MILTGSDFNQHSFEKLFSAINKACLINMQEFMGSGLPNLMAFYNFRK